LLGNANDHVAAPINGGDFDAYYLVTDIYGVPRVTSAPDKASSGSRQSNLGGQLKNLPNLSKSCNDISVGIRIIEQGRAEQHRGGLDILVLVLVLPSRSNPSILLPAPYSLLPASLCHPLMHEYEYHASIVICLLSLLLLVLRTSKYSSSVDLQREERR
jgi:hypothetical protein